MKPVLGIAALAALGFAAGAAGAGIVGEAVDYTVGGETFEGYLARNTDLAETKGTVLILHDWDGLTENEERRADMLAALGYTAFAADLFGKAVNPTTMEEFQSLTGALLGDRELLRQRLTGSLEAARAVEGAPDDVVVIGYCFGGAGVLELARAGAEADGFVSFHGGLGTPEGQDYSAVKAPVLLLHGAADPYFGMAVLAQTIDELQAAGVPMDAEVYGGARHSFTVWGSPDYDLDADTRSWAALQAFLADRF